MELTLYRDSKLDSVMKYIRNKDLQRGIKSIHLESKKNLPLVSRQDFYAIPKNTQFPIVLNHSLCPMNASAVDEESVIDHCILYTTHPLNERHLSYLQRLYNFPSKLKKI